MKLLTVTFAAVSLVAISSADLKSDVTSISSKVTGAIMKGDMKSLESVMRSIVTADFKYVEGGKTMTFDQMWKPMKASMSGIRCTMAKSTVSGLKEKGNMATGVETHHMMGTMIGADKKSHKLTVDGTSTNTYMMVGKSWKMSKRVTGENKMTIDGKTIDMAKMGGGK